MKCVSVVFGQFVCIIHKQRVNALTVISSGSYESDCVDNCRKLVVVVASAVKKFSTFMSRVFRADTD